MQIFVFQGGRKKLNDATSEIMASEVVNAKSKRLFIFDREDNRKFLIDTGADISIIPKVYYGSISNADFYQLFAANGTPIKTFGKTYINVNLGFRRNFTWQFVIADVKQAIIGADFLEHFDLLVDLKRKRLIDSITKLNVNCIYQLSNYQRISTISESINFFDIFDKFRDLAQPPSFNSTAEHSNVVHQIITNGQPVFSSARRLDTEKLNAAKKEFEIMMRAGICQPSKSPWASPLHMVKKRNGEWRPCGDYRRLNAITIPDRYPLPHIHDFAQNWAGKTIFTKIDLIKAYHQVPLDEESRKKTSIITPFGLFEFNFMPFGLRNASQMFQCYMNHIFHDLEFVYVYIEDICIASKNESEHRMHIEMVLERFQKFNIKITWRSVTSESQMSCFWDT